MKEQPCWTCKKASGQCCWSYNFRPIKNWVAKKIEMQYGETKDFSYKIEKCPEYEEDSYYKQLTTDEIAKKLGVSRTTVLRRLKNRKIKKEDFIIKIGE